MFNLKKSAGLKKVNHLAISTEGIFEHCRNKNVSLKDACAGNTLKIKSIVKNVTKQNIPIITVYIMSEKLRGSDFFSDYIDVLQELFSSLLEWDFIDEKQVKVSVLGKWYDLPGRLVDQLKEIIDKTKDYDSHFLNFCINYDGQEEIVDACKMIARQIKSEKIDVDSIDKEMVKENVYTSYFMPPDLFIINGLRNKTRGFLLWDSPTAKIHFTNKFWVDITPSDVLDIVKENIK